MNFDFFSPPRLFFGPGKISLLPNFIKNFGRTVLLVTGGKSFQCSSYFEALLNDLKRNNLSFYIETITREPSPSDIDTIVASYGGKDIDVVTSIGGGSVLDAGKAISAMLTKNEPVMQYLEGVGNVVHDGEKIPFIAVPTTAGTGSEATKNAVICQVGENGFKKSLRHDNFIPDMVILDPNLTINCPSEVTAACGMDALTQVLESLVSTKATPMTNALALGGLKVLRNSLIQVTHSPQDITLRSNLSYAAYISGLTLANAGLGLVHGFASVIGGYFDIPHGVVCGTLVAPVTRKNIETLTAKDPEHPALKKYGKAAALLDPSYEFEDSIKSAMHLAGLLDAWSDKLKMPGLGAYAIKQSHIKMIAEATGQKNNPCNLGISSLSEILQERL